MTLPTIQPLPPYMLAEHRRKFDQQVAADKVFALDIRPCRQCRRDIPKEFTFCSKDCHDAQIKPLLVVFDIVEPDIPEEGDEGRGEPPL